MMNTQNRPKEWHVGTDEVGRPILEWDVDLPDALETKSDKDPLAQTYNFLKRLDVPGLELEQETEDNSVDPYDHTV